MKVYSEQLWAEVADEQPEKGLNKTTYFIAHCKMTNEKVAKFALAPLPGCCGVVVSHDSEIFPAFRSRGYGRSFHAMKEAVAIKFGYSAMLATTQLRNIPEVVGAAKARWRILESFRNLRTQNDIGVMVKVLHK